jgi:hypothetical protein
MRSNIDEAYERLHRYGPEYGGDDEGNHGLTNHGPMAAEVVVRRGLDVDLDLWLDRYVRRLAELPVSREPIGSDWRTALGDARRLPDWTAHFADALRADPWTEVLALWWPRLLPGIIAGSTHGVIRVGHAVRTLTASATPSAAALDELASGLGFWAARHRTVRGVTAPAGGLAPEGALPAVARLAARSGRIADRLTRLEQTSSWPTSLRALRPAATQTEIVERLDEVIVAAVHQYARHGYAAPVLLVHTATAPNAVRHVLPVLPAEQWQPSLTAAWAAAAAVTAMYASPDAAPAAPLSDLDATEALHRAAAHGDEHVIKFADTAVDAYTHSGDPDLLAATIRAAELIARPTE